MGQTKLRGNPVQTSGELPAVGSKAPPFSLTRQDLSQATLETYAGKKKILNIFPSIDTGVCAKSVKTFAEKRAGRDDVVVLDVSADLPFAAKRFCGAEAVDAETLSTFRSTFATDYGVKLMEGGMAGLCARAIVVLDESDTVVHTELVDDIVHEPGYDAALAALTK
jgi:thiol peroxidase